MKYSIKDLIKILNIKNFNIKENINITGIAIDSRKVKKGDLFIPFIGNNVDGHNYIKTAFNNGASASFTMKNIEDNNNILQIEDSLIAIQKLAKDYINKLKNKGTKIIAITGSNGKTTTKDIIFEVLSTEYKVFKTQGNYNNELGVPLTILAAPYDTEILILEMGADGFGQLELLSEIAKPNYTIITNIGESHIEFFKDRAGIAKGKFEINTHLEKNGKFIYNGDEPLLVNLVNKNNIKNVSCGENKENNLIIDNYKLNNNGSTFDIIPYFKNINTNLIGKHNALNILYSLAIAKELKINDKNFLEAINNLKNMTKMRLEKINYKNNSLIINDAYNASPTSMISAINIINEFKNFKHKTIILGDMFELGSDEINFHKNIGKYIEKNIKNIDTVITVGKLSKNITDNIKNIKKYHFKNIEDTGDFLIKNYRDNEILLFKASRGMKLEKIIENLLKG